MPLDAQIPLSVQVPQPQDPIAQYGRVVQLQGALQGQQLQQAQLTGVNQENQMRQTQMDEMHKMNDLYRAALTPGSADGSIPASIDTGKLTTAMAQAGLGHRIPDTLKGVTEYQKSVADLSKTNGEVAEQQRNAAGLLGYASRQADDDPRILLMGLQHAVDAKGVAAQQVAPTIQALQQAFLQDPSGKAAKAIAKQFNDSAIGQSDKAQTLINQATTATGNKERGDAALANSQRLADQTDLRAAAAKLGQAKTAAEYKAIRNQLPAGIADNFDRPEDFDPTSTPAKSLRVGMTPAEIQADRRSTESQANTQDYRNSELDIRRQQLQISQQNADSNASRLPQNSGVQGRFEAKEIDAARKQLDGIHQQRDAIGAAMRTPDGQNYVDPKTGRISTEGMTPEIRSAMQQQINDVTNAGQRIIARYGDDKSGGRIRSNELPAPNGQTPAAQAPAAAGAGGVLPSDPTGRSKFTVGQTLYTPTGQAIKVKGYTRDGKVIPQ